MCEGLVERIRASEEQFYRDAEEHLERLKAERLQFSETWKDNKEEAEKTMERFWNWVALETAVAEKLQNEQVDVAAGEGGTYI